MPEMSLIHSSIFIELRQTDRQTDIHITQTQTDTGLQLIPAIA